MRVLAFGANLRATTVGVALLFSAAVASAGTVTFVDDFNRTDPAVGNGWVSAVNNAPNTSPTISGGAMTTSAPYLASGTVGVYRQISLSGPISFSGAIGQENGSGGLLARFDTSVLFGGDGSLNSGYGLYFSRSDQNFSNSTVNVMLNGAILESFPAPFQFLGVLSVSLTLNPAEGSIVVSVSQTANGLQSFTHTFGPRTVSFAGTKLGINMGLPGAASAALTIPPTVDDVAISYIDGWIWPIQNSDSRSLIRQDFEEFQSACITLRPNADPATSNCTTDNGALGKYTQHHTGFDIGVPEGTPIVSAAAGTVVLIQRSKARDRTCVNSATLTEAGGCGDHGDGNTILLQHNIGSQNFPIFVYTQYQHLWQDANPNISDTTRRPFSLSIESSLAQAVRDGKCTEDTVRGQIYCKASSSGDYPVPVFAGELLGFSGRSGNGTWDFWPQHLHFEIKSSPTLGVVGSGSSTIEYGYTSELPHTRGYIDPSSMLENVPDQRARFIVQVNSPVPIYIGPGMDYPSGRIQEKGKLFIATSKSSQRSSGCSMGWMQIITTDRDVSKSRQVGAYFQRGELSTGGLNPDAWICTGNAGVEWVRIVKAGNNIIGDVTGDGVVSQSDICLIQTDVNIRRKPGTNDIMDLNLDGKLNNQDAKLAERLCTPDCALALCP